MFLRDNSKGMHLERWRHTYGCGKWFLAARDTVTLEVFGTYFAQTKAPPPDIIARIRDRTSGGLGAIEDQVIALPPSDGHASERSAK